MKWIKYVLFIIILVGSVSVFADDAQLPSGLVEGEVGNPPQLVAELAVLAGLSLLPYVVMLLTSYVKIVVVLSLLRNALGVQQSPPNQVLNGIALLMSIYVMFPTGVAMYNSASKALATNPPQELFTERQLPI
jgi:type III secretion protein R